MKDNQSTDPAPARSKIIAVFDRAAPTYDRVGPRFFSHFGQELVTRARILPGTRILDIACGRGATLFPAAKAAGPNGKVIGIDLSAKMVQQTSGEILRRHGKNIEVLQMDAEALRFPDMFFDYVLCGFALFFFSHLEIALSEMRRVLKPGGLLALSTWDKSIGDQWTWFEEITRDFLPPKPEPGPQSQAPSPPEPEVDTPSGLTELMKAAGFTGIQVIAETFESIYSTESDWWASLWSHGTRSTLERIQASVGSDGLDRFRSAVFQRLQGIKKSDGLHITWPALFTLCTKPNLSSGQVSYKND